MAKDISLEKALQAYRVISAPVEYSFKKQWANQKWSSTNRLELVDPYEINQSAKPLMESKVTMFPRVQTTTGGEVKTLLDVVNLITDKSNKNVDKMNRKIIYSTETGQRPVGDDAWLAWNGFQIIDMDIKSETMADALKPFIFNALCKFNWFVGVIKSSSGQGLHVYTKIQVDPDDDIQKKKLLFLTNFRHKYSFVYIACLNAMEPLGFDKQDLISWLDLHQSKPAQGAFVGYDPKAMINTGFFEDYIYINFDNIEHTGHPEIDWMTYPDLRDIFKRWEWFEEPETIDVKVVSKSEANLNPRNKVHYKHNDRWRLANTLVKIYGPADGKKYLRMICSNDIPTKELVADCITAQRHKKPIDVWAVKQLNNVHGFKIKLDIEDKEIEESDLLTTVDRLDNPNIIRKSERYVELHINRHQYLGNILNQIMDNLSSITLIEAGPGLGKTEMVKQLVDKGNKIMLVMPFTSTIKSKVEDQEGWYYSYGSRKPRLDVDKGLALTIDKFSRLNPMDIQAAGFNYVFIDESHLMFMSEYRPIMARVVEKISHMGIPVVMMSGTPTGELVFFQDITHIHVIKEETRKKELMVNMVHDTSTLMFHMCKAMAKDIAAGRRVLFPSNEGTLYGQKIKAGVQYFLQQNHQVFDELNYAYYKKSQVGEQFMDDINFEKTIKDIQLLMCTSYLSVGVDILDKYDFSIYFGDLCTAAEADQWANRLRSNNLYINLFIAKNDADGNPRYINKFRPMNFKLDDEEIADMHSIVRLCNAALERNPIDAKYNSLISSIVHNNSYVKYNENSGKYELDEMTYKIVMFERKYRAYAEQLPVFMKGMQSYGYELSARDLGQFNVEGAEIFKDLKNMIKLANDNQLVLNTQHVEELLEDMSDARLYIYKDVLSGKMDIYKGADWKEVMDPKTNTMRLSVKSIEVFEKVVPIFLSLNKMFETDKIVDIFYHCKRKNGTFNFAAINRFRSLVNILSSFKKHKLDNPIVEFMDGCYRLADREKIQKTEVDQFIVRFATAYADRDSTKEVLINGSPITKKMMVEKFKGMFKCLVDMTRPDKKGFVTLNRVEVLWETREEKLERESKNQIYILQDFIDAFVEHEEVAPVEPEVIPLDIFHSETDTECPF